MYRIKRAYAEPVPADGLRVLVDRLWPRGLSRTTAAIDLWLKEIAPSAALRQWFGHDPERWPEFQRRYREELSAPERSAALARLRDAEGQAGMVTLLYAARDETHNHAAALLEMLHERR